MARITEKQRKDGTQRKAGYGARMWRAVRRFKRRAWQHFLLQTLICANGWRSIPEQRYFLPQYDRWIQSELPVALADTLDDPAGDAC